VSSKPCAEQNSLMTLMEAKVEEETVHFANDGLLDGG
jgi:hypothetical protein